MANLPSGQFNPEDYQDMRDFTPVPPGKYIAKIVSSELKDTKTGGQMLVLAFEIAAGAFAGKGFVSRLNLVNASAAAVKIANEELATITRACGLGPIQDSEQLHNVAMVATLKLNPADGSYGPSNTATGYITAQGLTTPPVNPEPDEATLAILSGTATSAQPTGAATAEPTKAPEPPAGFAAPAAVPEPPAPAVAAVAPAVAAEPPPTAVATAVPAVDPAPAAGGQPPW